MNMEILAGFQKCDFVPNDSEFLFLLAVPVFVAGWFLIDKLRNAGSLPIKLGSILGLVLLTPIAVFVIFGLTVVLTTGCY